MAQPQGPQRRDGRPRAKTPAERAEEAADVQRRLKQEAAERRQAAARNPSPAQPGHAGPPGHGTTAGRRRTP